ncbi:MAG TPA: Na-translocating system protein MpsB, partial [Myxococcota bacterium]|nr:Na-translocating system protein MpsB [Myxococcota bacterium]
MDPAAAADLRAVVAHLAHRLPGQAPISAFVHHNTLHGDQALGFHAAVAAASRRAGVSCWPAVELRRQWLMEGRITEADLRAVIADRSDLDPAAEVAAGVSRGAAIGAILRYDVRPIDPSRLRWELVARRAAERPPDDLAADAKERVGGDVSGVWAAVREGLGLSELDPHPEHLADLEPGVALALRDAEDEDIPADDGMLAYARERVATLVDRVGRGWTTRELALALTGADIEAELRPYVARWMAGFLDEGVASWTLSDRQAGLWACWRALAPSEPWDRWGLGDAVAVIADAPEDSERAVEAGLDALGIGAGERAGFLDALALRLPGFFGMTAWRERRPDWPGQALAPARLMDALAVRCTVERIHLARLARRAFGCGPSLVDIRAWMEARPVEVLVREALHAGHMPGHIAWRARAAEAGRLPGADPCLDVARAWWTWMHTRDGDLPWRATLASSAWPVFRLALGLGLREAEVRAAGPAGLRALRALVDELDDDARGRLWLEAYERRYREEVLGGLHHNRGRGRWRDRPVRPAFQVAFCIDDREEGVRRHLEVVEPECETLGVAGFFGVPILWRGLDDRADVALCPPAITAVHRVGERPRPGRDAEAAARRAGLGWIAW